MPIHPSMPVADIARRFPVTVRVLHRHRLDFCCGGRRPLEQACAERGVPAEDVLVELLAAVAVAEPVRSWDDAPADELIAHIVERYHRRLRDDLPVLHDLAVKVASRHGEERPALLEVRLLVAALVAELSAHMEEEELVLFPTIRRLADGVTPLTPLVALVREAEHEHLEVGRLLDQLHAATGGYVPPEGACQSFRGLYAMLAELDHELREHVHLENDVLFPRALAMLTPVGVG